VNSTAVIWQRNVGAGQKNNKGYKVMLQNIKQLYGDKLAALDGDIGHVKRFLL